MLKFGSHLQWLLYILIFNCLSKNKIILIIAFNLLPWFFSYNILEPDKSKLDIGYQHEFDKTIPYVGDGTLKIGGVLDKSGQNFGVTFKKKFAKGGLAKVLGV